MMDSPMRPSLLVSAPPEKVPFNHGSPLARQPATSEKLSRANAGDKKLKQHHREGKGRSRDGIFRHRMHHVSAKAGNRGSLSTYRDQDSEDDGLLQPVTRDTTRSRWGSESTGLGPGSRRGSVLDGIDEDMRLGSIKRPQEIHSMDGLQRIRDQRSKGEEYLRSALSVIGTLATDITRRLDYTYYGLLEKIAALNVTISSFQELSDSTSRLFDDFQRETSGLEQDIRKQIGDLQEFQPQMQRIEALEERMRASKTRAKTIGNRLEAMRSEIERWDKREMEWQMRTNQRLRIFWGFITTAILAILVAIVIQHWPNEGTMSGFRTLPRALKIMNFTSHMSPPKLETVRDSSSLAYNSTPSPAQVDYSTSSEVHEIARPTDYDPLRMFNDL